MHEIYVAFPSKAREQLHSSLEPVAILGEAIFFHNSPILLL